MTPCVVERYPLFVPCQCAGEGVWVRDHGPAVVAPSASAIQEERKQERFDNHSRSADLNGREGESRGGTTPCVLLMARDGRNNDDSEIPSEDRRKSQGDPHETCTSPPRAIKEQSGMTERNRRNLFN